MEAGQQTLGIKILDKHVAIETYDSFGDLSKYDFIYDDFISSNKNGNTCYGSVIKDVKSGKNFVSLNGWKLLKLSFPGNWVKNWGDVQLEDRYGKIVELHYLCLDMNLNYFNNFNLLIREVLGEVVNFTNRYPFKECKEVFDGLQRIDGSLNINEFHQLVESVDDYIKKYLGLKDKLTSEEQLRLGDKLKIAVSENISSLFGFSITFE